jgi:hypothetical protein
LLAFSLVGRFLLVAGFAAKALCEGRKVLGKGRVLNFSHYVVLPKK